MTRLETHWRRQVYAYHPVIGWWHLPNLYARLALGQTYHVVQTNAAGMRATRDYPLQRPPGRRRVLFLGDSYTAGDGVSNAQRFTDLLETRFAHLDALNFGLNGSGTDQQLLIYENLAHGFEADAYVLCVCVENIARNAYTCFPSYSLREHLTVYRPKPWFELGAQGLVLKNQPVPLEKRNVGALGDWRCAFPQVPGARDPYAVYADPQGRHWRLMKAILERFLGQVRGKPVLVVPLPMDVHYLERFPPTYLPRFLELDAPAQGVHVVDLLPAFTRLSPRRRRELRFPDDPHYTRQAHAIVADALEYELARRCPQLLAA